MNRYEILLDSDNKITIETENTFSSDTLRQILQSIHAGISGEPEISIDDWKALSESAWSNFIYVSDNTFQNAGVKLLEKLSKDDESSKRGYFVSCFTEEVNLTELDALFEQVTKVTDINEIIWASSVPKSGKNSFISLMLLK